jgi:retron-type reverse transcriptase
LIHINQYGFIKSRTIQDCIAWAFEYLHICHRSKKEIIIIKLDFEKAFDLVEHSAVLTMLKHMGFGDKFLSWIKMILTTASTSIILNGVPGKSIRCKRGVRQGDPLSPLLFVAAAELLQIIINHAWENNTISLPIDESYGQSYPILQYADDTLLIMPAEPTQILELKRILKDFTDATGLSINYHKSSMVPINITEDRCNELALLFGCKKGNYAIYILRTTYGNYQTYH